MRVPLRQPILSFFPVNHQEIKKGRNGHGAHQTGITRTNPVARWDETGSRPVVCATDRAESAMPKQAFRIGRSRTLPSASLPKVSRHLTLTCP